MALPPLYKYVSVEGARLTLSLAMVGYPQSMILKN